LAGQKTKLPFYLYAYCFMPNHIHLLVERREDEIGRVMHRLLTGYSRYFNKKQGRTGHLFQKRYKAILCQTDQYLAELVRYIHLNPVRAKMVSNPAAYVYSSYGAYLGMDKHVLVDIDPVLRLFGATRKLARERFEMFVSASIKRGHCEQYYPVEDRRILGSEEFVDATKKRVGEIRQGAGARVKQISTPELSELIDAVAKASGLAREDICGSGKSRRVVMAKEALIVVGRELGASNEKLAKEMCVNTSVVSRRFDSGKLRLKESRELRTLIERVRDMLRSPT
jgi:REP-associated tyrosine transposase